MIKVLENAIEKIKALPEERQRLAADLLEQLAADANGDVHHLSDEEWRALDEGLAELDRGEAATDLEVRAVFDKYR